MSNKAISTNQPSYQCEGLIKEVKVSDGKVVFTLEPMEPYLFEAKTDEGKSKRHLLFVDNPEAPKDTKVLDSEVEFSAPRECDLSAIIIAKANRLKVRIASKLQYNSTSIAVFTVL